MTNPNPFIRIIRKDGDPVPSASGDHSGECTGATDPITAISMKQNEKTDDRKTMVPTSAEKEKFLTCNPAGSAAASAPGGDVSPEQCMGNLSQGVSQVIPSHSDDADFESSDVSSDRTSVRRGEEPEENSPFENMVSSKKPAPPIPASWNFIRVARDDDDEARPDGEDGAAGKAAVRTQDNGRTHPQKGKRSSSVSDLSGLLHKKKEEGGSGCSFSRSPQSSRSSRSTLPGDETGHNASEKSDTDATEAPESSSKQNNPFLFSGPRPNASTGISASPGVRSRSSEPVGDTSEAPATPLTSLSMEMPGSDPFGQTNGTGKTEQSGEIGETGETGDAGVIPETEGTAKETPASKSVFFSRKEKGASSPTQPADGTIEATSLADLDLTQKKKGKKKGLFGRKKQKEPENSLSSEAKTGSEALSLAELEGNAKNKTKKSRFGRKKNTDINDSQKVADAPIDRSNGVPVPFNEKGTAVKVFEDLLSRFGKKVETPEVETSEFVVVPTGDPRPVDNLRTVDITYEVDAPFQYVRVAYNAEERALRYMVIEPELSPTETHAYTVIEGAFQKLISTDTELITGSRREEYLKRQFNEIILILGIKLTDPQKERIYFHMASNYLGYSKLDTLMKDKYIEDVSCNGADLDLYVVHRMYGPVRTNVRFENLELNSFVLKLAQISGRHISLLQPIRDITLPDGSRGNLTLGGEVTKKGSTFTIRKFRANPISATELMGYGTIGTEQMAFLWLLMEYKRSLLVSGGTASGKTTLLNVLCSFIPIDYKIVSIEDTAELNLMHPNWLQSITRQGFGSGGGSEPSGIGGGGGGGGKSPGDISLYDLLIAALRQRPEFILVGEVRGPESFTLFQAIAVGHAAMGTIHAGTMDELISRVESNPMNVPRSLLCNLDAIIFPMQIKRGETSIRRVVSIVELLEMDRETGDLVTNTVFKWVPEDDTFRFSGRSYLFDKIRETFGVSLEILQQEVIDRAEVLQWMMDNGIREYHASLAYIRMYYRDKDELMAIVRGEQENAVNPAHSE